MTGRFIGAMVLFHKSYFLEARCFTGTICRERGCVDGCDVLVPYTLQKYVLR